MEQHLSTAARSVNGKLQVPESSAGTFSSGSLQLHYGQGVTLDLSNTAHKLFAIELAGLYAATTAKVAEIRAHSTQDPDEQVT